MDVHVVNDDAQPSDVEVVRFSHRLPDLEQPVVCGNKGDVGNRVGSSWELVAWLFLEVGQDKLRSQASIIVGVAKISYKERRLTGGRKEGDG